MNKYREISKLFSRLVFSADQCPHARGEISKVVLKKASVSAKLFIQL